MLDVNYEMLVSEQIILSNQRSCFSKGNYVLRYYHVMKWTTRNQILAMFADGR